MSLPSRTRVIKLTDAETVKFLKLYEGERLLYDASVGEYKNRDLRNGAAKRISDALGIPGFGPRAVISKFKNLRSSYCQELKKIADGERPGAEAYVPKVFWFDVMHSFIRPFVQQRPAQSFLDLRTNQSEDSRDDQSQRHSEGDFHDTTPSASRSAAAAQSRQASATPPETPNATSKRKLRRQPSSSPAKKTRRDPTIDFSWDEVDDDGSNRVRNGNASFPSRPTEEDCYDFFGKYVASLLRAVGPPTAMRLQAKITCLITNTMCLPQPDRATQHASGRSSNMSEYSDGSLSPYTSSNVFIKMED